MKLRVTPNDFGPAFSCIDDNEYDGAPDAGPQLVGEGNTEEAAKQDFMDQWMERESDRDCKRAVQNMKVIDGFLDSLFGRK
jgi:hypothetical protein